MKANSNLAVLKEFARLGAGFDIVSGGELKRALAVGADPARIVFSGVGKQAWEMRAALAAGVMGFNVESEAELQRLSDVAQDMGLRARVSLRVNPDVDAQTHPYISTGLKENKFGVAFSEALALYRRAAALPQLSVAGIDCHIGSQLTDTAPLLEALDKMLGLIDALASEGIAIHHLDLGGGLGIRYRDEVQPSPKALLDHVFQRLQARGQGHLQLVLEPGRSLVGNAGVLLTTVQYLKHGEARNFAIVDAAMNDLLRPALYDAWHGLRPVRRTQQRRPRALRRRRPGLRKRRLSRPATRALALEAGRPAGRVLGRRLRHDHGRQLQHPPARGRGHGRRRPHAPGAAARKGGRPVRGRVCPGVRAAQHIRHRPVSKFLPFQGGGQEGMG